MAEDQEQNGKDEEMRLLQELIEGLRAQRKLQKNPTIKKLIDLLVRAYLLDNDDDPGELDHAEGRALDAIKNLMDIKMERKERGADFDAKRAKLDAFEDLLKGM